MLNIIHGKNHKIEAKNSSTLFSQICIQSPGVLLSKAAEKH
jgi:hypothetical protein